MSQVPFNPCKESGIRAGGVECHSHMLEKTDARPACRAPDDIHDPKKITGDSRGQAKKIRR